MGLIVVACLIWQLAAGLAAIDRPGYAPDEEVTALVVSSSDLLGVPRLPSGAAYWRGVVYTRLAAISGAWLGDELFAFRLVSLLFGMANVLLLAVLARRWFGPATAAVAAVFLATLPLHVAISAFARPYTPVITALLAGCLLVHRAASHTRAALVFLGVVALAQGMHEAGVLMIAVPAAVALTQRGSDGLRRRAWQLTALTAVIAIGLQYLVVSLFASSVADRVGRPAGTLAVVVLRAIPWPAWHVQSLAGPAGWTFAVTVTMALAIWMHRRWRLTWLELAPGAALATVFLPGAVIGAAIAAAAVRPERARQYLAAGGVFVAASAAVWITHTILVTDAAASWSLALSLLQTAGAYPLAWFTAIITAAPLLSLCAFAGASLATAATSTSRSLVSLLVVIFLLVLGIAQVPLVDRYFAPAMPMVVLLAAWGVIEVFRRVWSAVPDRGGSFARQFAVTASVAALAIAVVLTYDRQAVARGDFGDAESHACFAAIPAGDVVVCNDELACRYLIGRVDAWILPGAELRQVCAVEQNGVSRGIYAGSEVLADQEALDRFLTANSGRSTSVILLDTPKFGYAEQQAIVQDLAGDRNVAPVSCGPSGQRFRFGR